jgi:hypothetical protein
MDVVYGTLTLAVDGRNFSTVLMCVKKGGVRLHPFSFFGKIIGVKPLPAGAGGSL